MLRSVSSFRGWIGKRIYVNSSFFFRHLFFLFFRLVLKEPPPAPTGKVALKFVGGKICGWACTGNSLVDDL